MFRNGLKVEFRLAVDSYSACCSGNFNGVRRKSIGCVIFEQG